MDIQLMESLIYFPGAFIFLTLVFYFIISNFRNGNAELIWTIKKKHRFIKMLILTIALVYGPFLYALYGFEVGWVIGLFFTFILPWWMIGICAFMMGIVLSNNK